MRTLLVLLVLALTAPVLAEEAPPRAPLRTPAQRAVLLAGTRNTRDLGGLPAAGGYVRNGKVYRSGALCFATEVDVETLRRLGLTTVLELRTDEEIQRDGPDRVDLVHSVAISLRLPMSNSRGRGAEAYGVLLEENGRAIRGFFELLADPKDLPMLFHCSAGKDRTGILTALLLEVLGTPRAAIMDDYLQSVRNSPNLVVEPEWLQVVFAAIDRAGGIGPFLDRMGVTEATRAAVRRNLIEPAEKK